MGKISKAKYYGVFARNLYGVYNDYGRVLETQQYARADFKVKKFNTFSEAEEFAIDGFCDYAYAKTPFPDVIIPEKLPLNWMVYPYKTKK